LEAGREMTFADGERAVVAPGSGSLEIRITNPILDIVGQNVYEDMDSAQIERIFKAFLPNLFATHGRQIASAVMGAESPASVVSNNAAHQSEIDRLLAVVNETGINNLQDLSRFATELVCEADCETQSNSSCFIHLVIPIWLDVHLGGGLWARLPAYLCVNCGAIFLA
jgi:hypothetical protein